MILELHLLQNLAPSNVNRDESGSPKDCTFGGVRRARISSQSLKRAMRREFATSLPAELLATRTKRVPELVARELVARGRDVAEASVVAARAVAGSGLTLDKDEQTGALTFIGADQLLALANACDRHWDVLAAAEVAPAIAEDKAEPHKKAKKASPLPVEVKRELAAALDGSRAIDLALFGRMIAEMPGKNVDAASQVAHAISTHRVDVEFDYFTAMDELSGADESGAAMIGTIEFNSATYYRYLNLDLAALGERFEDASLVRLAAEHFMRSAIEAIPGGKQNTLTAQNRPSMIVAVLRDTGHEALTNAFLAPVRPHDQLDLMGASAAALDTHWGAMRRMYGSAGIRSVAVAALDQDQLNNLSPMVVESVEMLIGQMLNVLESEAALPKAA